MNAGYPTHENLIELDSGSIEKHRAFSYEAHKAWNLHTVHVDNMGCWCEWSMVRKPDNARGREGRENLYIRLMPAHKLLQVACISALKSALE